MAAWDHTRITLGLGSRPGIALGLGLGLASDWVCGHTRAGITLGLGSRPGIALGVGSH